MLRKLLNFSIACGLIHCFTIAEAKGIYDFIPRSSFSLKKNTLAGIDSVVCINLDARPEKWATMISRFNPYNIQLQRFPAVDGWKLTSIKDFKNQCCFKPCKYNLTNGEIGIYLSHLTLWKQALKQKLKTVWILEDDASIKSDPRQVSKVLKTLDQLAPDWDLLYTDSHFWNNTIYTPLEERKKKIYPVFRHIQNFKVYERSYPKLPKHLSRIAYETAISPDLKKVGARWGLHSVIFSKRGLQKLVNHFDKLKIALAIDSEIFLTPNLKMYATKFDIVGQDFTTTISDTREHY